MTCTVEACSHTLDLDPAGECACHSWNRTLEQQQGTACAAERGLGDGPAGCDFVELEAGRQTTACMCSDGEECYSCDPPDTGRQTTPPYECPWPTSYYDACQQRTGWRCKCGKDTGARYATAGRALGAMTKHRLYTCPLRVNA